MGAAVLLPIDYGLELRPKVEGEAGSLHMIPWTIPGDEVALLETLSEASSSPGVASLPKD